MKIAYEEESPGIIQFKIPLRWNWQFLDNPFIQEKDGKLPIWIALKGNEIAGQICAMPMQIKIGGETYNGGWGCDLIVLKKFRRYGIAWKLNKLYCDHFPVVVHIVMARTTQKIWEKCGSTPVEPFSIMWKVINLDQNFVFRYLNHKTKSRPTLNKIFKLLCKYFYINYFISFNFNIINNILNFFKKTFKKNNKLEITEIKEFNNEFYEFIEKNTYEYKTIVKRDPKFLRWKYIDNLMMPYHFFILKKNNVLKGYIVLRKPHPAQLNIGTIADIFTAKNDTESIQALVDHAIAFFGKSVQVIQCLVSLKHILKIFKKFGFITIKKYAPHFLCSDKTLQEKLNRHNKEWFITLADHDLEQILPIEPMDK
jgi:hypothetical protein